MADCPDPSQHEIAKCSDYCFECRFFGDHKPGMDPKIVAPDGLYATFDRLAASQSLRLGLSHSIEFRLGGEP